MFNVGEGGGLPVFAWGWSCAGARCGLVGALIEKKLCLLCSRTLLIKEANRRRRRRPERIGESDDDDRTIRRTKSKKTLKRAKRQEEGAGKWLALAVNAPLKPARHDEA